MVQETSDHELIRNSIARYCLGIDFRDWDLFSKSFTDDVKFLYPEPVGTFEGAPAMAAKIQSMIGSMQTQHALNTQVIELTSERTAEATTYGRAIHFGTGEQEGRHVTAYGAYKDKLIKDSSVEGVWRIFERKVLFLGPFLGDQSLLAL